MSCCEAKIRPFPNDTELHCEGNGDRHWALFGDPHHAVLRDYAFPGSATTMTWQEHDRRSFRGEWIECPDVGCVLPAGHRGGHET